MSLLTLVCSWLAFANSECSDDPLRASSVSQPRRLAGVRRRAQGIVATLGVGKGKQQRKGNNPLHLTDMRCGQAAPLHSRLFSSLRVALLLLCLCAVALSGCRQNTSPAAKQNVQHQGQSSTLTYVAIGASDTFGTGTDDPYAQNWPGDLAKMLNQPIHLINLGIPGITVHEALTSELPIALDAHPALVTVWLAVNDLADRVPVDSYKHDLNTLLSRLQTAAPHARIAVGNMPDLTSLPFFSKVNQFALSQQIAAYNTAITSVVTNHHAILVDLSGQGYNVQTHPEYISSDGLHPSDIGYVKLAMLFYDALQQRA